MAHCLSPKVSRPIPAGFSSLPATARKGKGCALFTVSAGWLGKSLCLVMASCAVARAASPASPSSWKQIVWQGEKAWESTSAGWTAIVSEERARLISLAADGGENLLFASTKHSISWGGHRCWLGPQDSWNPGWPPPVDWEASAAAHVQIEGSLLSLTHAHTNPRYPQMSRTYEWRDGVLHCTMSWQGGQYYSVHILQVPRWSVIHLHLSVTKDIPLGYALPSAYLRPKLLTGKEIAPGISRMDGNDLTLWHACVSEKLAVAPQEIIADIGNCQLLISRGPMSGMSESEPDRGLLTQVFLGDWENPFIELEQCSAFGSSEVARSEILVTPSRKGGGATASQ